MRALAVVGLIAAMTMMLPAAVVARQSDDRSRCFAREGVSPEQKLVSCTADIEAGGRYPDRAIDDYNEAVRLNPQNALGVYSRCLAYLGKSQNDRAIENFEAIRLNPKFALAFGRGH